MAPHAELHASSTTRSNRLDRRFLTSLSTARDVIKRASSQYLNSRSSMIVATDSRVNVVARSSSMDGGEIAGAVVASVIGVSILLLVLGFLYFRHRRRALQAENDFLPTKEPTTRRVSFPGPGHVPGQNDTAQRERPPPVKDDRDRDVPVLGDRIGFRQSPTSEGNNLMHSNNEYYTQTSGQDTSARDFGSATPQRSSGLLPDALRPISSEQAASAAAAAASYYDTNISMDSDPELPSMAPPTRQMTEMYQEQLRLAREKRKNSKSSTLSRLMNTFKRKRSSHSSDVISQSSLTQFPTVDQPDLPRASIEGPNGSRGGPWQEPWEMEYTASATAPGIYEEPQEISVGKGSDYHRHQHLLHQKKRSKQRGASQDTSGEAQPRLDSLRTALDREPTLDTQLPSSALRQTSDSLNEYEVYGERASFSQEARRERMMSPEIPEPMDVDAAGLTDDMGRSAVRNSYSPPVPPGFFVNPMAIMNPSNDTEKAHWNDAELIRIENSASPPPQPNPSPNYGHDEQQAYDAGEDDAGEDEDVGSNEEDDGDGDTDLEMMPIPEIDEPGQTSATSDYSTPPGQSSTNASSGRTPDTRITHSLSPFPNSSVKVESSASPEALIPSPKTGLTCEECGRSFDQIHKLNHHKRYHDRKHECTYEGCDKKFGTKTHLDRHINDKHEKKKGFHCTEPSCAYFRGGKAFPRKDNWRRHMQNKHGLSPQSDPEPAMSY